MKKKEVIPIWVVILAPFIAILAGAIEIPVEILVFAILMSFSVFGISLFRYCRKVKGVPDT